MRIFAAILALLSALLALFSKHSQDEPSAPISIETSQEPIYVRLENNQVLMGNRKRLTHTHSNGTTEIRIVYEFLNMPFAEPPVGERRFQAPIRLKNTLTSDIYNATFMRTPCMQVLGIFGAYSGPLSEDCLYLNVWVPVSGEQDELLFKNNSLPFSNSLNSNSSTRRNLSELRFVRNGFLFDKYRPSNVVAEEEKRATLFWVHGGGNVAGLANDPAFDGAVLASSENVLVASTNYRLGPLGWLYLNNTRVNGNAGLNDLALAVEWYRERYLALFGGHATRLCLFGESAGAMDIHALLVSAKNSLFDRVIMESGQHNISWTSVADNLKASLSYLELTNCSNINKNTNVSESTFVLTDDVWRCLVNADANYLNTIPVETPFVKDFWNPTGDFVLRYILVYTFKNGIFRKIEF